MKKDFKFREIPYNYTSFSDKEIILKYFDEETWDMLNILRQRRVTGRSAKLLFEIIGDIFIIDRNPYIYNNLLESNKKIHRLEKLHDMRLSFVSTNTNPSSETGQLVNQLLTKIIEVKNKFFANFEQEKKFKKKIYSSISEVSSKKSIHFSAFHKVAHATDATDWRVEYPTVVVYPDQIHEMRGLVRKARKLGLKIIARGGGTGLTGGAIPIYKETMIINTEKLKKISAIETVSENGRDIPVIEVEAGVVTHDVIDYCKAKDFIFATDPTSAWASTIGGNIAENAGGKKCVMWGTCIDNLYSYQIVDAQGHLLEVQRRNHPHRKISPDDEIIFDIYLCRWSKKYELRKTTDKKKLVHSITLSGTDIRKKGLGKDVTNKALKGVPGLQKEGGDGIIVSAKFVLYKPFQYCRTLCLEFFGSNLVNASKAIVDINRHFEKHDQVFLTALEHWDEKYSIAINYRNKSARRERPKAVLLIDVESNDENLLNQECQGVIDLVQVYNTDGFIAEANESREKFWKDRKNLGAIARHTNAFKLNEDVVIPLDKLPEFADYMEKLNIEKELSNNIHIIAEIEAFLNNGIENQDDFITGKISHYSQHIKKMSTIYLEYMENLDEPAGQIIKHISLEANEDKSLFELIRDGIIECQLDKDIVLNFKQSFHGYDELINQFVKIVESKRSKKIIIATHMHAGDGNIHVNIPVHSNDYMMMHEADETAGLIMEKTVEYGGVITGEHGIGLTKLRFIDQDTLDEYAKYKKEYDPEDIFNPGKLDSSFSLSRIYTPSFNLLEHEAFILTATDLEKLTMSIASCVRCCKCKDVCNTHYPPGTMFYHPRNKILGVALIAEAVLYDIQASNKLSFRHFKMLRDISDHCTLCHKCQIPCPVKIDFGEVTLNVRRILLDRKKRHFHVLTWMTLFFLRTRGFYVNKALRLLLLKVGYGAQRVAHYVNKPISKLTASVAPQINNLLKGRFPKSGKKTLREILNLKGGSNTFYAFQKPDTTAKQTVIYFPGCGSERVFPEISLAVIALLYAKDIQVIIPPEYLCCGFPLLSNGKTEIAETKNYENRVIFHKMAETVNYMDIKGVLVTCGTCFEMLEAGELETIFDGSQLMDVNEFISLENLYNGNSDNSNNQETDLLYHDPCHSPLKKHGWKKAFQNVLGTTPQTSPNCCGEGGTMSLSTPDISNTLRSRKKDNIISNSNLKKNKATVLTTCPSCVQGLSKIQDKVSIKGKHLTVFLAEQFLGKGWQKKFIKEVKNQGIEKILM